MTASPYQRATGWLEQGPPRQDNRALESAKERSRMNAREEALDLFAKGYA